MNKARHTQNNPIWLWLLYRSWLSRPLRFLLTRGLANRLASWWYSSRLSRWRIARFVKQHAINTQECTQPLRSYQSFNDFFTRRLHKDARPIDKTPRTLACPADGSALVIPQLTDTVDLYIKNQSFCLPSLVGDAQRAAPYQNGSLMVVRLAPHDYHRFHMPVGGTITHLQTIGGRYESVDPYAYRRTIPLLENKRAIFEIRTPDGQKLLLVAVGALCVGSIVTTYNPRNNYQVKGGEIGYFSFGGSTMVLITPPQRLHFHNTLLKHSAQGFETTVRTGQAIGQWQPHATATHSPASTRSLS